MNRRTFVAASAALCATAPHAAADPAPAERDLYELRTYTLKPGNKHRLDDYLAKAFIPAVKRLGAGPVGVLVAPPENDLQKVIVLIVHPTAESVVTLPTRLAADPDYRSAAATTLAAKADETVYQRIDSSLLTAFVGMPKLARPDPSQPRLFNLRVYESHNERAAAKKVEMFEKGEIDIFRRVGLTPVFFASALVGADIPNLTYLLAFPDEAGRKTAWDRFRADPEWLAMKAKPEYFDKEIVSRISNYLLTPTDYSEI